MFDGTTTENDWIGFREVKELPFGLNGEKGFYGATNNRVVPDNSELDIGAN